MGLKSQKIAVVGAGANGAGIGAGLVRAGLDVTFIEHRRMPRRCGRTGFGSSCRTRLWSHMFTCVFWTKGRRGEAKTSTAFVVRQLARP